MRESEELTMKKGSIGMGARQLFSDMQAGTNAHHATSTFQFFLQF
jgi:hypothetical protein